MINRLQSIELQGFKTFSNITRLEFPGQVTAIVGPNGSGKSNIADSIRWVLGEQSYSLLRAKRTEDMIFSGSQQRPRAGMAATTITFNNEDGWLPIDYAEVTVSRRAYRDGQNEYLLNGQKVRLKDITELLAQTGLAEMSYTIIGQGLVDVALALKPDERRQLFEEAAGIGLYRTRKEDALRRLDHTRKNLDRVLDILTEIRPRLRSLEKQSVRFTEFEQLREDLEIQLREWYGYHWHQTQQDLRNVRNAYDDQEKRLQDLRLRYDETEINVEESRTALQTNRKALEAAHRDLSEYHHKLEQFTRELAILEERRRSNTQQKSNLEIDLANVQELVAMLEAQRSTFEEEIQLRLSEFDLASDEMNRVDKKLSAISTEKTAVESQLGTTRTKRVALETELVQLSARLAELRNRLETSQSEQEKIETALKQLDQMQQTLADERISLADSIHEVQSHLDGLTTQAAEKDVQIEEWQEDKRACQEKIATLETNEAKLSAQMDVLGQAEAALSGYSDGSKALMEDARKGRLPKGFEPLSQHLVVDEKYEQALSAALGELADLLIVPTGSREVVIEYLEAQGHDRVALLTSEATSPRSAKSELIGKKGVLGLASDLIQVDAAFMSIVSGLLADIVIVEDRATALSIQSQLQPSQKAVTLSGLVFQPNGIVISGQTATAKRIGRTRRKNEMQQELHALERNISDQREKLRAAQDTFDTIQKEQQDLLELITVAADEKKQFVHIQQKNDEAHTRMKEQRTWHTERLSTIIKTQEETAQIIQDGEANREMIDVQVRSLVEDEKIQLEKLSALPVFELQQELNQWQTHQIVAKNALETSRQRSQDHYHRMKEAQQRLQTHQTRLADLGNGLGTIDQEALILKGTINKINAAILEIEKTRIKPLSETSEISEISVVNQQKIEEQTHQQVIIAERQYTQLQLELSRRNDQLQHLQQRIEDDFGLVAYDYEQRIDGPKPLPFVDGLIKDLPNIQEIPDSLEEDIKRLKAQIRRIGPVNPEAQQEYFDVKERFEFLTTQIDDLDKASKGLRSVISELDQLMEREFIKTFKAVNEEFSTYFTRLFSGGEANLRFSDEENPVEGGVDIEARLPGRRSQGLALLSGGERSLTAVALIFALLKVSPTPFCILDEVDAMLDESNVGRFIELLRELSKKTQFVIITHNRNTVQAADVIYGVTMGRDSTSQMISLKLEDVDDKFLD